MLELNKIYNMDCLEGMKQIDNNSVDLILTDPPYNTGMSPKNTSPINHPTVMFKKKSPDRLGNFFDDDLSSEKYQKLVIGSCIEFQRILKKNHAGYIFINWKQLGTWINSLEKVGLKVKNVIVWDKIVHGLNYQNYAYTYELIIFFIKGEFFPNNKQGKYYKDVWNIQRKIDTQNNKEHHETVKNIKIIRLPLIHASKGGDLILDPFIGSGTTAVACKQLNRKFIGFEISPEYCKIANQRLEQGNLNTFTQEQENLNGWG